MNQTELEQKVVSLIKSRFPMTKGEYTFDLESIEVVSPKGLGSIQSEYELKLSEKSLESVVKVSFVLKKGDTVIEKTGKRDLLKIPALSLRGTYIINGQERVISNQLRSKHGPYTEDKGDVITTKLRFPNSSLPKMEVTLTPDASKVVVNVGAKNFGITNFLRYIGCDDLQIRSAVGRDILADRILTNGKAGGQGTLRDLFNEIVLKRNKTAKFPDSETMAIAMIQTALTTAAVDGDFQEVLESNLNRKVDIFDESVILDMIKKTIDVSRKTQKPDNRDDLIFQKALSGEDLIMEQVNRDIAKIDRGGAIVLESHKMSYVVKMFDGFGKTMNVFMKSGQLSDLTEQTNPLHLESNKGKITLSGEGGLSKDTLRNGVSMRNLKPTGVNRLDPVHTPESSSIGVVNYLTQDAKVENGTVTSTVYRVSQGVANTSENNVVRLSPKEEMSHYIAFYDVDHLKIESGKLTLVGNKIPARYAGQVTEAPRSKIEFIDKAPQNLFGYASNLIPFGHHNDGNRMLMGANMQTQALELINREEPLVQVATDSTRTTTYEDVMGDKSFTVKSPFEGTIISVDKDSIKIKGEDGQVHNIEIYDYFPLNMGHHINNEPVVKIGDMVKKGQLLAEGWSTKNGKLALGVNARVGFLSHEGDNFEDGIVISEGFAEKSAVEEMYTREVSIGENQIGGTNSNCKKLFQYHIKSNKSLENLDADGIIKVGSEIKGGDIVVARLKKPDDSDDNRASGIISLLKGESQDYTDASEFIQDASYTKGKVLKVERLPGKDGAKETIKILISSRTPLKLGDKIAGRHGNKGTVTKIKADKDMPQTEDGKVLDVLMSPLVIPSRKNLGQLYEVNAGLIAEKEGTPFKALNFSKESEKDVEEGLKRIGLPDGKMTLIDPESGKPYDNKVTVGNMYMMKLKHKADEKIQARSFKGKAPNMVYMEPSKSIGDEAGEKRNPQKIGIMEMNALQAHKAINNILEVTTLKGDGAGDVEQRANIFRVLSGEQGAHTLSDYNGTPESLNIFKNSLLATGFKATPLKDNKEVKDFNNRTFNEMMLTPSKDEDVLSFVGENNKIVKATTFQAKQGDDEAEKGGLFDPRIFGMPDDDKMDARSKWGYIKLNHPIPNPILAANKEFNPYAVLTPFSKAEIDRIMKENVVVIIASNGTKFKEGTIVDSPEIEKYEMENDTIPLYKAGGDAILYYLKKVDVEKELKELAPLMKEAKAADRNNLYKRYRMLKALKDNNMKPEDYMTTVIPVLPTHMRPRMQDKKNIIDDDLNKLYAEVVNANNKYESTLANPEFSTASQIGNDSSHLFKTVSDLYGQTRFTDRAKGKELQGVLQKMVGAGEGRTGKDGLVQKRMLSKKVDYSGRSVIGTDPNLKLNQVGLPVDMAKSLYEPFIIKELYRAGYARNHQDAEKMIKTNNKDVMLVINKVVKDRPLMINRAPTLHKLSLQAFEPVVKDFDENGKPIRTMQLNPLVVGPFNADHDGDTMAAHVPLTDAAVKEAFDMMPSNNLTDARNGRLVPELKNEMILGLYYLTLNVDKPTTTKAVVFQSYDDMYAKWAKKEVGVHDLGTFKGTTSTVGELLINFIIPDKYASYRNFKLSASKKEISKILDAMYADKNVSDADFLNIIDRFKNLGFKASTKSGLSLGLKDFKAPDKMDERIEDVIKRVDKQVGDKKETLIAGFITLQDEIEKEYEQGKILDKDNPAQIMMASGARGNSGQFRRMGAVVGVGMDIGMNRTAPVKGSHLKGLSPQDYWLHSFDSRKGMYDRSVSTSAPGALTKEVMASNQDILIAEKDCGTSNGILIKKADKTIVGRVVPKDVIGKSKVAYARKGEMITKDIFDKIGKDDTLVEVMVRSAMTCSAKKGICQKCYGAMPGKTTLVEIGEPIGVVATQSLGEPVMQMTMNTFHSGGLNSQATLGLPRIKEIMSAKSAPSNMAVLANTSGVVKITDEMGQKVVYVGNSRHVIGKNKDLRVNDGDTVKAGDFLTVGDRSDILYGDKNLVLTNANPGAMLKLKGGDAQALRETQDYLANSMDYAFQKTIGSGNIDKRHIEVTVGQMTSKAVVADGGDSPYVPGQTANRTELERWNMDNVSPFKEKRISLSDVNRVIGRSAAENISKPKIGLSLNVGDEITKEMAGKLLLAGYKEVKVKPRPIVFENSVSSLKSTVPMGHDNWMSNTAFHGPVTQLARGATFAQVDKLDSMRSRQMAGKMLNVGKGYTMFDQFKDKANGFANSLVNMFR